MAKRTARKAWAGEEKSAAGQIDLPFTNTSALPDFGSATTLKAYQRLPR